MTEPGARLFATLCLAGGAALMLLAVALGAFGAHALQGVLEPRRLASYQTAVTYQAWHALGVLVLGAVARIGAPTRWLLVAASLLAAGIVLFCGSIYALAFGAPRALGGVTPLGGVCFMAGWGCVAMHALAERRRV